MVLFHMWLLPGGLWVTVKDLCSLTVVWSMFHFIRVLEFYTVVGENHGEQCSESIQSQPVRQIVKHRQNTFLRPIFQKEHQHKVGVSEYKGEKTLLAASGALYGIHFHHGNTGMVFKILVEIFNGAPSAAFVFQFGKNGLLLSLPVGHFLRKVDIFNRESVGIDIVVDGLF